MNRPLLLLDTCSLRHISGLSLGKKDLFDLLVEAFEVKIPEEIAEEIRRHIPKIKEKKEVKKILKQWKARVELSDQCLSSIVLDLPKTESWYPHDNFYPVNSQLLFNGKANKGERDLLLLHLQYVYLGRTPILLSDDLKARRLALNDIISRKIPAGLLWISLDFLVYLVMTGALRKERKDIRTKFILKEVQGLVRDLVNKVSSQQVFQQQLIVHYHGLVEMLYNTVVSENSFNELERKYGNVKYR
jgi:hypothetical protein